MKLDPAVLRLFTLPTICLTGDEWDRIAQLDGDEIVAYLDAAARIPDLLDTLRKVNPR